MTMRAVLTRRACCRTAEFAIQNRNILDENAVGLGAINARIDDDGIIRRASLLFRADDNMLSQPRA